MKKDAKTLNEAIAKLLGDSATSDDALTLMGDITDSIPETTDQPDTKKAVDEAVAARDAEWRQKFLDRFTGRASGGLPETETPPQGNPENKPDEPKDNDPAAPSTYEELFKGM